MKKSFLIILCIAFSSLVNAHSTNVLTEAIKESDWQLVGAELQKIDSWSQESKDYYVNLATAIMDQRKHELTTHLNTLYTTRNFLELGAIYLAGGAGCSFYYLYNQLQQEKISCSNYLLTSAVLGLVTGYVTAYMIKAASLKTDLLSIKHLNAIYILEILSKSHRVEIITIAHDISIPN